MFTFTHSTPFEASAEPWARSIDLEPVFWLDLTLTGLNRLGLVIRAGATASFHIPPAPGEHSAILTFGAAAHPISADGLDAVLTVIHGDGKKDTYRKHVSAFLPEEPYYEFFFPIRLSGGGATVQLTSHPGPKGDPSGDWLALYELAVAAPGELSLARARAFNEFRRTNELEHFAQAYDQPFYAPEPPKVAKDIEELTEILLEQKIGRPVPDFETLLHRRLAMKSPLRILSLASGAARVEAKLLRSVRPELVQLTLTDINPLLLETAAKALHPHKPEIRELDLNKAELPAAAYDIILCVSAVHHVVELESLSASIRNALAPGGEFWSIGEFVGRTGARLWPEAYEVANRYFRSLPARLRWNRSTRSVDENLPNLDCSVNMFESIRSEEVLPILQRHLTPEWMDIRSCILWRLFESAYAENYSLDDPSDVALVEKAVQLDYDLMQKGSKPVSLNGVFRIAP